MSTDREFNQRMVRAVLTVTAIALLVATVYAARGAMEVEAGRSLERFFERWIYGATLPKLQFSYRVEAAAAGQEVVLHVEQIGELFDVPLTVTLQYADRKAVDVLIPVSERVVDMRVALAGTLRGVEIDKNEGTLAEFIK